MPSLAVLRVPSSAKKSHFTDLGERHRGKSLIKMPNSKGPRIDPWGTPHVIDVSWEYVPFTSTHCSRPRSGELRTQKLKSHLVRTQSLTVLPLKPGVDQYIAIHATLTARDFFLSCLFLHFRSIHLHFCKTSPDFSLCWLWLTHSSCVGPQNKTGHPAGCRFPCWVPAEYK